MTNPREKTKTGQLSQTTITFLEDWAKSHIYPTVKEFKSKYTDKGNKMENPAIAFAAQYFGWGLVDKEDTGKEDEYFTGTCDVLLSHIRQVNDIKNSYHCYTFPLFAKEIPEKSYSLQVQGYAHLYDCDTMAVVYTLMNMPDSLVTKECYSRYGSAFTKEQWEYIKEQYTYEQLPEHLRIKRFCFERDSAVIDSVIDRVKQCRQYIHENIIKQL